MTMATSAVDEIKMCSDPNCSKHAQLVAAAATANGTYSASLISAGEI
jgi:hypothetical protein